MKQIIDIPDELFNIFKKHGIMAFDYFNEHDKDQIAIAITHGIPYNPTGVLTEADKKICKIYLEDLDKMHTCNEYKLLMSLIDNAQAVDLWQMRQEATENALKKAEVLYGRPKGEWKVRPHIDADGYCDGYELYCSECGDVKTVLVNRSFTLEEATECLKSEHKNFCFECGADMRGE